jgi:hypothetical protein
MLRILRELVELAALHLLRLGVVPLSQALGLLGGQPQLMELASCDFRKLAGLTFRHGQLVLCRAFRPAELVIDLVPFRRVCVLLGQHHAPACLVSAQELFQVGVRLNHICWRLPSLGLDRATHFLRV